MFCRQCGTRLNEGAGFCPQCGMATSSNEATPPPPAPVAAPVTEQWAPPPAVDAPPPAGPSRGVPGIVLAAVIASVVLLVLAGAFVALYFAGKLEPIGLTPRQSVATREAQSPAANKAKAEDTADEDEESEPAAEGLPDDGSFETLTYHYERLWTLHTYVGVANADGSYGGTGFAYETFNAEIGSPDYAVREELVSDCEAIVEAIAQARAELEDESVSDEYADQKDALLGLYDLLGQRADVMLAAATIALDDPDEAAWRPTLSPASSDARKQFEEAYPMGAPEEL